MSIRILSLKAENIKRIKVVDIDFTGSDLTIIGGDNLQGKTSVIDAIAYGLGGERLRPTNLQREDSLVPPNLEIKLSNGIVVKRKGKNSSLFVTDSLGMKSGQSLLDSFIPTFALNIPKFFNSSNKQKAETLLEIIGLKEQLSELEKQEKKTFDERHTMGQIADQKKKFADEHAYNADCPETPISIAELLKTQQGILLKNAKNNDLRNNLKNLENELHQVNSEISNLEQQLAQKKAYRSQVEQNYSVASTSSKEINDESTKEIEEKIGNIEEINVKVRINLDKEKAIQDASIYNQKHNKLTEELESIRKQKFDLLDGANFPLKDLSVMDSELTYKGKAWDCMATSEQYIVATAIVKALSPECGFVLFDKLESIDLNSLESFRKYLEKNDLQIIGTRVSTGDECTIIIEDGTTKSEPAKLPEF